jgi:SagB-type dehydrogenase family enzyme
LYAFVRRTDGAADGLYHYDVPGHSLQLIVDGDLFPRLESVVYTYPFMREANLVIVVAAVFGRTQKKYGPRGYRYILLEAGHAGQNICLRAVELGLSTLCMGGFVDCSMHSSDSAARAPSTRSPPGMPVKRSTDASISVTRRASSHHG